MRSSKTRGFLARINPRDCLIAGCDGREWLLAPEAASRTAM
jgi:hypothetical protein